MFIRVRLLCACASIILFAAPCCHASTITLAELVNGGELQAGALRFSEFSYVANDGLPSAEQIAVSLVTDAMGAAGLRFSLLSGTNVPAYAEGRFDYVVQTVDPNSHLVSARMSGDPAGYGILTVTQEFADLGPLSNFIFTRSGISVTMDAMSPALFGLYGDFNRHKVTTMLSATGHPGIHTISYFEQTYVVPEPSPTVLGAIVVFYFSLLRRTFAV